MSGSENPTEDPRPTLFNRFWLALSFLTRIPVPKQLVFSQVELNKAAAWFPWVGILVGVIHGLVTLFSLPLLGPGLAAAVGLMVSLGVTGAFHEDGLADSFDGLYGGYDPAKRLAIMKDSRLGTYGAGALFITLLITWLAITELAILISPPWLFLLIVTGHCVSRWFALVFMTTLDYVRDEGKSKPLAIKMADKEQLFASLPPLLLVLVFWLFSDFSLLLSFGPLVLIYLIWAKVIKSKIGGYTGDTLGAAQQLAFMGLLLTWVAQS